MKNLFPIALIVLVAATIHAAKTITLTIDVTDEQYAGLQYAHRKYNQTQAETNRITLNQYVRKVLTNAMDSWAANAALETNETRIQRFKKLSDADKAAVDQILEKAN